MKKLLTLFLTVLLLLSLLSLTACSTANEPEETDADAPVTTDTTDTAGSADAPAIQGAGTEEDPWLCGATAEDDVQVFLMGDQLWVCGTGNMVDFESLTDRPWHSAADDIAYVSVFDEITGIGKNAFKELGKNAEDFDVFLASTLVTIGESAFEGTRMSVSCIITIPEPVETIGANAFADSDVTSIYFNGTPAEIGDNAFGNLTAEVYTIYESDWNEENKLPYGGDLTYKSLFVFAYEEDYGTEDISGEGMMYLEEDREFTYDATPWEEGYVFVRWEVLEGDLTIEDPTDPVLTLIPTGNTKVKIIYTAA